MPSLPLLYAKIIVAAGLLGLGVIRTPHDRRNKKIAIAESRRGTLELIVLIVVGVGMVLIPLIWMFVPIFSSANYEPNGMAQIFGALLEFFGLWIFYRSHADLGTNWSITLEVRKSHHLVTQGIYKKIRHPMYTSAFVFALGCALVIPNWVVGLAPFVAFSLLYGFRVGAEERMMVDRFGADYLAYKKRTKRIIPGLF